MNQSPEIYNIPRVRFVEIQQAVGQLVALFEEVPLTPQQNFNAAIQTLEPSAQMVARGEVTDPSVESARAGVAASYEVSPVQAPITSENPLFN